MTAELLLAFERDEEGRERPSRLLSPLGSGGCRVPADSNGTDTVVAAGRLVGALEGGEEGESVVGRLVTGCGIFLSLLPDSHVEVMPPSGSVARLDVVEGVCRAVLDAEA